jgi:ubiquitin thioesterase OTU1
MMRIGLKGAFGQKAIVLQDSAVVAELLLGIAEATSLPEFDVTYGFPPKPIDFASLDPTTRLCDVHLNLDGQRLQVNPKPSTSPASPNTAGGEYAALVQAEQAQRKKSPNRIGPTFSARPSSPRPSPPPAKLPSLSRKADKWEKDPPEVPLRDRQSALIQRVMPDDNSCLFRAIGKCVLGNSLDGMTELRSVVAQAIQADTDRYNEIVLEKPPNEYCRWIQTENSWGGAIEIQIIAEAFELEIHAINVKDGSVQRFNEGQPLRGYLVYSGIHWDVVVENPMGKWGEPDLDIAQFSSFDVEVEQKAKEIGKLLTDAGYYTDTKTFPIRCNVCGQDGNGEQWAQKHAEQTNHMDFGQVD